MNNILLKLLLGIPGEIYKAWLEFREAYIYKLLQVTILVYVVLALSFYNLDPQTWDFPLRLLGGLVIVISSLFWHNWDDIRNY